MTSTDIAFTGSIPQIYDCYLVPLIFEPYAADLAARVSALGPVDVLETAAGSGAATRALLQLLPSHCRVAATDFNQPMLDRAAATTADPRVTWEVANAQSLPFPDRSFDVVVCQFGAMFFPDKALAYREARRVLRARGHFVFSVWDRIETNEFAAAVIDAMRVLFPNDPPLFLARTPHGYHDRGAIEETVRGAGFTDVQIETVAQRSIARSFRDPAVGYCQGTPLRNEIEARDPAILDAATDMAAEVIAARFGRGPVDGMIQAHVITANV